MRKKHSFREPLGTDLNGLYITAAQMQFFLNRRDGQTKFVKGQVEFFQYFYKCAIYNVIWDLQASDPTCASFYWDEIEEAVAVKFPAEGLVMDELKKRKIKYFFEEEEEDE